MLISKNVSSRSTNAWRKFNPILIWGKIRRQYLIIFRPGHISKTQKLRVGGHVTDAATVVTWVGGAGPIQRLILTTARDAHVTMEGICLADYSQLTNVI